jgi:hypothetical protein
MNVKDPPSAVRSVRLTLVVTPDMAARLKAFAASQDKTFSTAIVDFLEDASSVMAGLTRLAEAMRRKRERQMEKMSGRFDAAR